VAAGKTEPHSDVVAMAVAAVMAVTMVVVVAAVGATGNRVMARRCGVSARSVASDFPIPIFARDGFSIPRFLDPVAPGFERGCSVARWLSRAGAGVRRPQRSGCAAAKF